MAVCTYCRSTVLRAGVAQIGKLSEIIDDFTPLQLGTTGSWKGRQFTVMGRLRLKYADGAWNEWSIAFQDGSAGWLSDASGQFVLTRRNGTVEPPLGVAELLPGRNININKQKYVVTDSRSCLCIGGEGELHEAASDGKQFISVDLRQLGGNGFITFDYSDVPASVYLGVACSMSELMLSNLRTVEAIERATTHLQAGVNSFECPSCGAALAYHPGICLCIACSFCHALSNIEGERRTVMLKQQELDQRAPTLTLGATGLLRGEQYQIIGFMVQCDNEGISWEEYLLYCNAGSFLWLTLAEGQWYLGELQNRLPDERGDQLYLDGKLYRMQSQYRASTKYVLGEFNWQVKVGDEVQVVEWRSGNSILSRETYQNEQTWTLSAILPAAVVAKAYGLPLADTQKSTAIIPWHWILSAWGVAFFVDICAHLLGRGSIVALVIAAVALWYPKHFFEPK